MSRPCCSHCGTRRGPFFRCPRLRCRKCFLPIQEQRRRALRLAMAAHARKETEWLERQFRPAH